MSETYPEELQRKTLETIEWVAGRHEAGVLSDRDLRLQMDVIWHCTSGLVEEIGPFMDELAAMDLTILPVQIVMSNGKDVFIVGRNNVTTTITDAKTFAESNVKVWFNENEAADHMNKLVTAFKKKGFRVV